ncbi:MAG: hypothetical protein HC925_00685 [Coleofasciculaceae cyanobacterium SM2_3_26]|nr:hypothetical protein [Coleofasciculaceae cyanobacterium SM2_3_26]
MVAFIQKIVTTFDPLDVARIKIFGQQVGDDVPAWSRDLELTGSTEGSVSAHYTHAQPVEDAVCCPKCRSTQIIIGKKGFGVGKAALGAVLLGPVGLAGGMLGSNKAFAFLYEMWTSMATRKKQRHQTVTNAIHPITNSQPPITNSPVQRSTVAKLKVMSSEECTRTGLILLIGLSFFGIFSFAIPAIGWLIGISLIISGFVFSLKYFSGDRKYISKVVGNCPNCSRFK